MKMYCATPTVEVRGPNGTITRQVAMFYLHPNVQGIVSEEHAAKIVTEMLVPVPAPAITVHPNVTLVDLDCGCGEADGVGFQDWMGDDY